MKIEFRDIIAILVLAGCGFLLYKGMDGYIAAIAAMVIGYYFRKRLEENGI